MLLHTVIIRQCAWKLRKKCDNQEDQAFGNLIPLFYKIVIIQPLWQKKFHSLLTNTKILKTKGSSGKWLKWKYIETCISCGHTTDFLPYK